MNKITQISGRLALFLLVVVMAVQPVMAGVGHMGRTSTEDSGYLAVIINLVSGLVAPFLA